MSRKWLSTLDSPERWSSSLLSNAMMPTRRREEKRRRKRRGCQLFDLLLWGADASSCGEKLSYRELSYQVPVRAGNVLRQHAEHMSWTKGGSTFKIFSPRVQPDIRGPTPWKIPWPPIKERHRNFHGPWNFPWGRSWKFPWAGKKNNSFYWKKSIFRPSPRDFEWQIMSH